jgi:hypothetical protein
MLRNFWAQINADGSPPVATGSDDKGGIAVEVMRRRNDDLESAIRVVGARDRDVLTLDVLVDGEVVYHERTPLVGV